MADTQKPMMDQWSDYELLDFGVGRKLERFGDRVLIRPCLAAVGALARLPSWNAAAEFVLTDHRSVTQRGRWVTRGAHDPSWTLGIGPIKVQLKLTVFGHVGLFPEHFQHWQWALANSKLLQGCKILNLFAYTGALSLLLANAGCTVVHVDASGAAVRWARRNAELSGLSAAPIRWIIEDAMRFVRREIKRGAKYDGVLVDAPTFGRGPQNESWQLQRDLQPLLELITNLLSEFPRLVLISSHTPGFDSRCLRQLLRGNVAVCKNGRLEAAELFQSDAANRSLPNGSYARWHG